MRKDKDNIPCCKQFPPCLLSFVILPHFYVLFKAEKRNGNMTVKMIDVCQFITFIEKKVLKNLCPRTQIINFASCSRECNVFSLG